MTDEEIEEMFYVEGNNFLEDLKSKKYVQLNEEGIDKVVRIIEKYEYIVNELEKDFERKIQSCTIEAETTTNDFYCRLHIATLKKWLNKIQELKGSDK